MSRKNLKDLSTRNPYHINHNRYLELKYFCFQYDEWKRQLREITYLKSIQSKEINTNYISDRTSNIALKRRLLLSKCEMIEQTAIEVAPDFYQGLIKGITQNISFEKLAARGDVLVGQREYYFEYRRFFHVLDKKRG